MKEKGITKKTYERKGKNNSEYINI